jgi:hypothetical protein
VLLILPASLGKVFSTSLKSFRVRILCSEGELGQHRRFNNASFQYPVLQDKNFDAMAIVFHAQGILTQFAEVDDTVLMGQIIMEYNADSERVMAPDLQQESRLWIGQIA